MQKEWIEALSQDGVCDSTEKEQRDLRPRLTEEQQNDTCGVRHVKTCKDLDSRNG